MEVKEVIAMLRKTGVIRIDCGQGSYREVCLGEYKNITEAALSAIECARFSPDTSPGETRHWTERIST